MMCREVSLMTIGLTPEFLSRAMTRHASNGEMHLGSMKVLQRDLAVRAKEWQRAKEATLNDVHILFHAYASRPEGPATPFCGQSNGPDQRVVNWFKSDRVDIWRRTLVDGVRSYRPTRVVFTLQNLLHSHWFRAPLRTVSWRHKTFPLLLYGSSCKAAWVFPWNMSFTKEQASCCSLFCGRFWGIQLWITLPSSQDLLCSPFSTVSSFVPGMQHGLLASTCGVIFKAPAVATQWLPWG